MPISKFLLSAKPMNTNITPKLDFFINRDFTQKQDDNIEDGNRGTRGLGRVFEPAVVLSLNFFITQTRLVDDNGSQA